MVLDLDQRAVGDRLGEPEDFAMINPRMPGHYPVSFAGFEQNSRQ